MSETTAFLAGSAVAGVAALLVLKGGFSLSQPEVPPLYSAPAPPTAIAPQGTGGQQNSQTTVPDDLTSELQEQIERQQTQVSDQEQLAVELQKQLESQQKLTEELKAQLEKQRETTEELKSQLESQRLEAERVLDQVRTQQRSMDLLTLQQALPDRSTSDLLDTLRTNEQSRSTQVIILWGLGGIVVVLIVGGGLILGSLVILLVQQRKASQHPPAHPHPLTLPIGYPPPPYGSTPYRANDLLLPPHPRRVNPMPSVPPNPYYDPYYDLY
ncbi:MAG: hypothetical protein ACO4CG_16535 [Prochlorothrix sp.]